MNGPKVQKVLKTVPVSEKAAHKLIARFLEREGQEEIMLDESLTRLQTICQSMGGEIIKHHTQVEAPMPTTPMVVPEAPTTSKSNKGTTAPTPAAISLSEKKKKSSADKEAAKSAKKEAKSAKKEAKKEAKSAKKEAKSAKKEAKKERKEKRKHDEGDDDDERKKKKRKKNDNSID